MGLFEVLSASGVTVAPLGPVWQVARLFSHGSPWIAVVAQGQSTSLVRTGSVVRFHSTAPLSLSVGLKSFSAPAAL